MMKMILAAGLALFGANAFAQESVDNADRDRRGVVLSLAGVVNQTVEQLQENQNRQQNRFNVGGGILVEAEINKKFGIETGALYVNRAYQVGGGNARLVQESPRLHVPVVARYWVSDYLSLAAGPFVAFRVGNTTNAVEVGNVRGELQTSADRDLEYGLDAAAALNFAINKKTGIFLEGRYSYLFERAANERSDHVFGLAGLKFDFGA